jgi:gliding motility-associated protein GldM
MYLVLTALLALNVSAEIFNAFEMVDQGLNAANTSLDKSNANLPAAIRDGAKKRASLQTYADRVDGVTSLSEQGSTYIDGLINKLIDESGTPDGKVDDLDYVMDGTKRVLKGQKNYDATTRLMVDGGLGTELKTNMLQYRDKFLSFIDSNDVESFSRNIPIQIDEEAWKNSPNKKENWSDFTFGHMPLGATMPIFTKFKNDIKASESAVLGYLANKVGTTTDVVLDKFTVVSAPKKSYIIKGEQFETDVFLSASAGTDSQTGITISVNGRNIPTDKDGVAKYTESANTVGVKKFNAAVTVKNPVTEEIQTYKKEFEYEVGERSVAISATKMNVFYLGVDNPVEISAAGVPSNQIKVSMSGAGGGTINRNADGTFNVKVTKPTRNDEFAKINVSAPGMNASKDFRVKRIPDPTPMLGNEKGGTIGNGTFKAYPGIFPKLEGFDFDAKCDITEFLLVRAARRQDPEFSKVGGGRYDPKAQSLVDKATPGDKYIFQNIKCKCPGDPVARDLGQLVFDIK